MQEWKGLKPTADLAFALGHPAHKVGWSFCDPGKEFGKARMRTQRFGRRIVAGQFSLGERRVDFLMADVMDQDRRSALTTLQLGYQMMLALRDAPRNGAKAKRAGGDGRHVVKVGWRGRGVELVCLSSESPL